jgi:two-component system LytT family response regulator
VRGTAGLLAALVFGALAIAGSAAALVHLMLGSGPAPLELVARRLADAATAAALVPLVLAVCRAISVRRAGLVRAAGTHVLGAVAFALLHELLFRPLSAALRPGPLRAEALLAEALARAKERLSSGEAARPAADLVAHLRATGRYLEWALVKSGDRAVFVRLREVDWIEAARNQVVLHSGGREYLFTATMKAMEESLDPALFLRIHRSAIVNLERVRELRPWFRGEYRVVLQGGQELTLSAGYRPALDRFRRLAR